MNRPIDLNKMTLPEIFSHISELKPAERKNAVVQIARLVPQVKELLRINFNKSVKFDLPKDVTDVLSYVRNKLIPELNAVKGVEILSYGEAYQVYDAQDDSIGNPDKDRSKVFGGDKRRLTKRDDDISGEG